MRTIIYCEHAQPEGEKAQRIEVQLPIGERIYLRLCASCWYAIQGIVLSELVQDAAKEVLSKMLEPKKENPNEPK